MTAVANLNQTPAGDARDEPPGDANETAPGLDTTSGGRYPSIPGPGGMSFP